MNGAEQFCARAKECDMDEVYRMHRRARDRTQIKAHDHLEVRYWATTLRCSEFQLRAAIRVVGQGTEVVHTYLDSLGVRVV